MSGRQPLVSILVPCYNYAQYVRRCVNNGLGQRYQNVEVVVYDDASTDGTREILLNEYGNNPRVKIICGEVNQGISVGLEAAAAAAEGEFLTICALDDQVMPNHVERLIAPMFDPVKPADLVWGNIFYMGEDGRAFPSFQMYPAYCIETGERNEFGHQIAFFYMSGASMLFRRDVFIQLGRFGPNYVATSEHEIPLRFAEAGKRIVHITQPTNMYLNHTEQFSRSMGFYKRIYCEKLDMVEHYATGKNHWRFRGYEARIIQHLNHLRLCPAPEVREEHALRHERLVQKLNAYALAPPPARPDDMPRVSIIAVCDADINSVLNVLDTMQAQTYTNWELVLLQYGCVSLEGLIQHHPVGHKVNHIYAPLANAASGWGLAQEMVRGELVGYVESNVSLQANYFETLVAALDEAQVGVVVGNVAVRIEHGARESVIPPVPAPPDGLLDLHCRTKPFAVKAAILHRYDIFNFMNSNGWQPPKAFYGNDSASEAWEFVLRCEANNIQVRRVSGSCAAVNLQAQDYWAYWANAATNGMLSRLETIYSQYPAATRELEEARARFGRYLLAWQSKNAEAFSFEGAQELMITLHGQLRAPALV